MTGANKSRVINLSGAAPNPALESLAAWVDTAAADECPWTGDQILEAMAGALGSVLSAIEDPLARHMRALYLIRLMTETMRLAPAAKSAADDLDRVVAGHPNRKETP